MFLILIDICVKKNFFFFKLRYELINIFFFSKILFSNNNIQLIYNFFLNKRPLLYFRTVRKRATRTQKRNELHTRTSRVSLEQNWVDEWQWYCFRLPPRLPRITRSLTFSAAAQDQLPISWQRRSKGQLVSEERRSLPTTDPPIHSPTFTARSGQIPTILRKITTSWRWLTSRDAASWRGTWVIVIEIFLSRLYCASLLVLHRARKKIG